MSVFVAPNFTCAADISGAGYGTGFEPVQRARFEALHSAFLSMGVSLRLDYVYGPEYAEARFNLMQDENDPVLVAKLQERWHRRDDARMHYLYGYSVVLGRPGEGFTREALMDGSPVRTVPASQLQTIRAALSQAIRDHELSPVVQAVDFRARHRIPV